MSAWQALMWLLSNTGVLNPPLAEAQQPSLSHMGCKTHQNNIPWVTSPCQTQDLTTWIIGNQGSLGKPCAVCTHTAVSTALSQLSDELWWAWPLKDMVHHPPPLSASSSPWDVSTCLVGTGEGDGDLVYNSAGPDHSLKQWWRCIGAKTLDYELWYRHTTFCAILCYSSVCRKYHEKHWSYTKPLLAVLELGCQSPYYQKRGIWRNTNHKPESFLLTKHPSSRSILSLE